jgi:23S rRNA (cytidine1920-2'-O)/16S rRNA (cytidine1409-2'-O)-methyltransferase
MSNRVRLDVLLVERALAPSREQARRLVMAGEVLVAGQPAAKPGMLVAADAELQVRAAPPFVSRGGQKLAAALEAFGVSPEGLVAADIGASTGGFTDCLLQGGAVRVYAVDVGYGQLDWRLRQDPRVVVLERTNIRYLQGLPEPVDLAVVDVSFISLRLVLPVVRSLLKPQGRIIALIKPQFEAGRGQVGKGGVVKDPQVHRQVLEAAFADAEEVRLAVLGLIRSPLVGPAGNIEFLAWLGEGPAVDREWAIAEVLPMGDRGDLDSDSI